MLEGEGGTIWNRLLAFNIGIELGQLLVVAFLLLLAFFVLDKMKVKQKYWNIALSSIAALISISLMIDNKFW